MNIERTVGIRRLDERRVVAGSGVKVGRGRYETGLIQRAVNREGIAPAAAVHGHAVGRCVGIVDRGRRQPGHRAIDAVVEQEPSLADGVLRVVQDQVRQAQRVAHVDRAVQSLHAQRRDAAAAEVTVSVPFWPLMFSVLSPVAYTWV